MTRHRYACFLALLAGMVVAAPVAIYRVIPSKIVYEPNEDGTVAVTLANTTDREQTATVRLSCEWGLTRARDLDSREVKLAAGEERTETFAWNVGPQRYGRGVRAVVLVGGQVVAERREFCNVIHEWWRVQIVAGGGKDPGLRQRVADYYHVSIGEYEHSFYASERWLEGVGPFFGYGNHSMRYCSMPSVFGDHSPQPDSPTKTWYSGRGWYPFTVEKLEADIARCKQWGYKNTQYSQTAMNGPSGFELARRRPEHVGRTATGAFRDGGYGSPPPILLSRGIHQSIPEWVGVYPNTWSPATIQWGAEALVVGIKRFGWDGVFFDGCGYVVEPCWSPLGHDMPNGQDPDERSAANIRLVRDTIRASCPDAFIWYNGVNPEGARPFFPSGNGGGRAGKLAMIEDAERSGGLKEMQTRQILDPRHVGHNWRSCYEIYLDQRRGIRDQDRGFPTTSVIVTGALDTSVVQRELDEADQARSRGQWAWGNHIYSLIAASGLHLMGGGLAFRPISQLLTRYSEFFYAEDLHVMPKAYKYFMVDSLREVWWEDSIYIRETDQYREMVLPLINTPDVATANPRIFADPEPADDVEITLLDRHDPEHFQAWAVVPYGYDATVYEPVQTQLKTETVDGEVVFAVPSFRYLCLVVIREAK